MMKMLKDHRRHCKLEKFFSKSLLLSSDVKWDSDPELGHTH